MKIAFFTEDITPEIGVELAGYGLGYKSEALLSALHMSGLLLDDGRSRLLLLSFDLLGLDGWYIRKIRQACAELLGLPESAVMLNCSHTHSGPETRSLAVKPEQLNQSYLDWLEKKILQAVEGMGTFHDCELAFYSMKVDENRNRRYVSADNRASFLPHRRELVPLSQELADQELGLLIFYQTKSARPLYVIGNYAAHPLAAHGPGLGGLRISADYPGFFKDYVKSETGAECMFISGAGGDLVPKEDELGLDAARRMGVNLGKAALAGIIDAARNPARFNMPQCLLGSSIRSFTVPLRNKYKNCPKRLPAEYLGSDDVSLEIQCFAIGDICFVGVPGELCCELGLEIKWHSPFRKTFIAYNATAYFSYIVPANFMVSGGYEAVSQRFSARGALKLLNCASDAMFELREKIFPEDEKEEPYPDYLDGALVNIMPNHI